MQCKPQITKDSYLKMTTGDKLNTLYDMQVITMECVGDLDTELKKRKFFDRAAITIGAAVGGLLGALGVHLGGKP